MMRTFLRTKKPSTKPKGLIPVQGKMKRNKVLLMNLGFSWTIVSGALRKNKLFPAPESAHKRPLRGQISGSIPVLHLLAILTKTMTTLTIIKMEAILNTSSSLIQGTNLVIPRIVGGGIRIPMNPAILESTSIV